LSYIPFFQVTPQRVLLLSLLSGLPTKKSYSTVIGVSRELP